MSARPNGAAAPEVVITPYRDGPLLVRGPFRLRDQDGRDIEVGRETVALCRCGRSRIRPFCDGTHKLTRFRAASGAEAERGNGARGPDGASGPEPERTNGARGADGARGPNGTRGPDAARPPG